MTDTKQEYLSFEEQYKILSQGVVDLINEKEFLEKLKENRPLKVKAGFDPSSPDLHLGHSLLINKLRQFQELGHQVIFVVGDFTACIGDPSGQNKTRPILSSEDAQKNAKTYIEQATKQNFDMKPNLSEKEQWVLSFFKRLNIKKTQWVYNSKWLSKIPLQHFILSICSKRTIARQLERRDFRLRYKSNEDLGLHEFLYPILQAYDSKELKADVELGGTDQLFNLLLGRELQKQNQQNPQVVLTLPLLEGIDVKQPAEDSTPHHDSEDPEKNRNLDGARKMSKSLNNAISFNDSAQDMYGKIMKISDELLIRYWKLFTEEKRDLTQESYHPKKEKDRLAWLLVCSFYGEAKATEIQKEFTEIFSKKNHAKIDQEEYPLEDSKDWISYYIYKKIKEDSSTVEYDTIKTYCEKLPDFTEIKKPDFIIKSIKLKIDCYIEEDSREEDSNKEKNSLKWHWIHDFKAYYTYRRIKENKGEERKHEITQLSEEDDFKNYISKSSIVMKIENYKYLDTKDNSLSNFSKQSKKIYEEYKNKSIEAIKKDIEITKKEQKMKSYPSLLKKLGLVTSKKEARQKIQEGAVKLWESETKNQKITDPNELFSTSPFTAKELLLSVGKRKFIKINTKWYWIHDLKAYLTYRKIKKNPEKKNDEITRLTKDEDFKEYISESSIKMKISNYKYLDTKDRGLEKSSKQSKEVYKEYKNKTIKEIEKILSQFKPNKVVA